MISHKQKAYIHDVLYRYSLGYSHCEQWAVFHQKSQERFVNTRNISPCRTRCGEECGYLYRLVLGIFPDKAFGWGVGGVGGVAVGHVGGALRVQAAVRAIPRG